ncbi:MAG: oligosaccharide flippase family protein, partial [bacterium]
MVTIRRVAEGYAALLAGVLLGKLLALASEAVLGRNLGPAGLGSYGAAVAVMGYGLAVANLGLDVVGLRTASLAPASAGRLAARIRACRLTMSLVVASLGIAGAVLGRVDLNLALPLCLVAIALAFRDDWLLMALGHERQVAVASVIRDAAFLSMVAFFLPRTHAVVAAAWSYLVAEIVWSLYIQVMVRLSLRRAATPVAQMPLVRVWSDGLPIAVISILTLTTGRVGTAVVSWLGGPAEGGTYYAASRVLIACLALTAPIGRATLPQLAKGRNANGPAHGAAVLRLTAITSMLGCVMALVLFHNPGAVMRFLYGPAFTAGASVLRILAGCIFLTASYSIGLQQLLADGRQGTLLWVTAAAAIANLSVALLLARRF